MKMQQAISETSAVTYKLMEPHFYKFYCHFRDSWMWTKNWHFVWKRIILFSGDEILKINHLDPPPPKINFSILSWTKKIRLLGFDQKLMCFQSHNFTLVFETSLTYCFVIYLLAHYSQLLDQCSVSLIVI